MGPLEAVERALARYATFGGRARRAELWWFGAAYVVVAGGPQVLGLGTVLLGLLVAGGPGRALVGLGAYLVLAGAGLGLGLLVPWYACAVRRLQDTGREWWLLLLVLVPYGSFALYWFWLQDGTHGPNRFGPDPKGRPPLPVGLPAEHGRPVLGRRWPRAPVPGLLR